MLNAFKNETQDPRRLFIAKLKLKISPERNTLFTDLQFRIRKATDKAIVIKYGIRNKTRTSPLAI
jgi:hypothetical protein